MRNYKENKMCGAFSRVYSKHFKKEIHETRNFISEF